MARSRDARSWRRTSPDRIQLFQKRSPACAIGVSMTFSSTVICGKGRGIWKVRASPARKMRSGERPSMRRPSKAISPASGACAPAIRSNSVLLPAPFGPIRPVIVPRATDRLTPSTARSSPKDRATPVACNKVSMAK